MSETVNNPGSAELASLPVEPASAPAKRKPWSTPRLILAEANDAGKPFSSTDVISGLAPGGRVGPPS
jgi:hypothetical protein